MTVNAKSSRARWAETKATVKTTVDGELREEGGGGTTTVSTKRNLLTPVNHGQDRGPGRGPRGMDKVCEWGVWVMAKG